MARQASATADAEAEELPKLIAAARELRDRWMEQINSGHALPQGAGKYLVSRAA